MTKFISCKNNVVTIVVNLTFYSSMFICNQSFYIKKYSDKTMNQKYLIKNNEILF